MLDMHQSKIEGGVLSVYELDVMMLDTEDETRFETDAIYYFQVFLSVSYGFNQHACPFGARFSGDNCPSLFGQVG